MSRIPQRRRSCLKLLVGNGDDDNNNGESRKSNGTDDTTSTLTMLKKRVSFSATNNIKEFQKDVSSDVTDSSSDPPMDMSMIGDRTDLTFVNDDVPMDMTGAVGPNTTFLVTEEKSEVKIPSVNPNTTFTLGSYLGDDDGVVQNVVIENENYGDSCVSPVLAGHVGSDGGQPCGNTDPNMSTYSPNEMSITINTSQSSPGIPSRCENMSMTINRMGASRLQDSKPQADTSLTFILPNASVRKQALRNSHKQCSDTLGLERSVFEQEIENANDFEAENPNFPEELAKSQDETLEHVHVDVRYVANHERSESSNNFASFHDMSMSVYPAEATVADNCQTRMDMTNITSFTGIERKRNQSLCKGGGTFLEESRTQISGRNGCLDMSYTVHESPSDTSSAYNRNDLGMSMTVVGKSFTAGSNATAGNEMSMVIGESVYMDNAVESPSSMRSGHSRYQDFTCPNMSMTMNQGESSTGNISRNTWKDSTKCEDMSMTMCPVNDGPSNDQQVMEMSKSGSTNCGHIPHGEEDGKTTQPKKKQYQPRKPLLGSDLLVKEHPALIKHENDDFQQSEPQEYRNAKQRGQVLKKPVPVPSNSAFGRFGLAKTPKRRLPESFWRKVTAVSGKGKQPSHVTADVKKIEENIVPVAKIETPKIIHDERPVISVVSEDVNSVAENMPVEQPSGFTAAGTRTVASKESVAVGYTMKVPSSPSSTQDPSSHVPGVNKTRKGDLKVAKSHEDCPAVSASSNSASGTEVKPIRPSPSAEVRENIAETLKKEQLKEEIRRDVKLQSPPKQKPDLKRKNVQNPVVDTQQSPWNELPASGRPLGQRNRLPNCSPSSYSTVGSPVNRVRKQRRVLSPKASQLDNPEQYRDRIVHDTDTYLFQSPANIAINKENTSINVEEAVKVEQVSRFQLEKASVLEDTMAPVEVSLFDRTSAEIAPSQNAPKAEKKKLPCLLNEEGLEDMSIVFQDSVVLDESATQISQPVVEILGGACSQRYSGVVPVGRPVTSEINEPSLSDVVSATKPQTSEVLVEPTFRIVVPEEEEESFFSEAEDEESFIACREKSLATSPKRADESSPFFETTTVESSPTGPLFPLPASQVTTGFPARPGLSTSVLRLPHNQKSSRLAHSVMEPSRSGRRATRGPSSLGTTMLGSTFIGNLVPPPPPVLKKLIQVKTLSGHQKTKLLNEIFEDMATLSDECFAYTITDLQGSVDQSLLEAENRRRKISKFKGLVYDPADPLTPIAVFSKAWMSLNSASKKKTS